MMEKPHAVEIEEVFRLLNSSPRGLTQEEALRRLKTYGRNVLEEERISKLKIFLKQFKSFLIYILLVAALISIVTGKIKDFVITIFLVLVNSVIGYWQELKAESAIRALKRLTESKVKVLRDGTLI
ncbi:MAG: cation-transporting P-type ATPase, partial [Candidatus Nezhaarchaeales archaeon]